MSGMVRSTAASGSQIYESSRAVFEYIQFHFGKPSDIMPYLFPGAPIDALQFPERTARICNKYATNKHSVLDLGCAVGGASFELSKHFDRVIGIDYSAHFIEAAWKMQKDKHLDFEMLHSGDIFVKKTAVLSDDVLPEKVIFQLGDACNLNPQLGQFDAIHASNLLCRLPNPRKFLEDIPNFIADDGILVLVSPYSWLEEYTSKANWIGGTQTLDGLNTFSEGEVDGILSGTFQLMDRFDIPFLIREHSRKFQYGVSDCTIWRKRKM